MVPDTPPERLLVENARVVALVLGNKIERDLGEKEVGAQSRGGADLGLALHVRHEGPRELPRRHVVEPEVGGRVYEALVNGVDVQVIRGNAPQVDAHNL